VVTRRRLSLFFIPVVPLRRHHWLACPECRHGFRLNREMRAAARRMSDLTSAFEDQQLPADDYQRIVHTYLRSGFVSLRPVQPDVAKTCGWCGEDVPPASDTCEACGQHCSAWQPACGLWQARDGEDRVFASSDGVDWQRVRLDERCPACSQPMRAVEESCTTCGASSRPRPLTV